MRFLMFCLLICAAPSVLSAQTSPPRIKILIVSTFHFGETSDVNKTGFPDLLTEKRQKEIAEVVDSLAEFKPDKIFVENEPSRSDYSRGISKFKVTKIKSAVFIL